MWTHLVGIYPRRAILGEQRRHLPGLGLGLGLGIGGRVGFRVRVGVELRVRVRVRVRVRAGLCMACSVDRG